MTVLLFFRLLLCTSTVTGFFYERFITIKPPDSLNDTSRFGYSIAYLEGDIYIGAPNADNIGKIFRYRIKKQEIYPVNLKIKREFPNYSTDYWLGASIQSGPDFVVTCAPRTNYKRAIIVTRGICFKIMGLTGIEQLPPVDSFWTKKMNGGIDSFGWSIDVSDNGIIAVAGHVVASGGVSIYDTPKTEAPSTLIRNDMFNFGYSIVSGNFLRKNEVSYAISSTYGKHGEGNIFIYDDLLNIIEVSFSTDEVGIMYGSTLCRVRLGQFRTSLLVGAPTFAEKDLYNIGAVYLYIADEKVDLQFSMKIIKGTENGGFFGASVISLGDIDGDAKDEVAIGAPYAENGAIYIYSGHGLLHDKPWVKKIQSEKFSSFGFSLASIPNVNTKICADLGVGAPLSNRAFILKCIPSLTVFLNATFPNFQREKINLEDNKHFFFTTCLHFGSPRPLQSKIMLRVELTHSSANLDDKLGNGYILTEISIDGMANACNEFKVLTPDSGNYDELLIFNITAELEPHMTVSGSEVFISDRSIMSVQKSIWAANCALRYGYCMPRLKALIVENTLTNPYKVGRGGTEQFSLEVLNSGETAYDACVVVSIPDVFVERIPPSCERSNDLKYIVCRPLMFIQQGFRWPVGVFEISTSYLTNSVRRLQIEYSTYDHCGNETEKRTYTESYSLIFDLSLIQISGISNPKEFNISSDDVAKKLSLQHVYSLTNTGPIDYYFMAFHVSFQTLEYVKYKSIYMKYKTGYDTVGKCSKERKIVENTVVHCYADFYNNSVMYIILDLEILPNTTNNTKINDITIQSQIELLEDASLSGSAQTRLIIVTVSVPPWTYMLSSVLAVILMIVKLAMMYGLGCFKRKNKQKLRILRESVRRQSMRPPRNRHRRVRNCEEFKNTVSIPEHIASVVESLINIAP